MLVVLFNQILLATEGAACKGMVVDDVGDESPLIGEQSVIPLEEAALLLAHLRVLHQRVVGQLEAFCVEEQRLLRLLGILGDHCILVLDLLLDSNDLVFDLTASTLLHFLVVFKEVFALLFNLLHLLQPLMGCL